MTEERQEGEVVADSKSKKTKRLSKEQRAKDKVNKKRKELEEAEKKVQGIEAALADDRFLASAHAKIGKAIMDRCAEGDAGALAVLEQIPQLEPKLAGLTGKIQAILRERQPRKQRKPGNGDKGATGAQDACSPQDRASLDEVAPTLSDGTGEADADVS